MESAAVQSSRPASIPDSSRILILILAVITPVTLVLMGLGSYVRATGAGLACPDWPLCHGRVIPHTFEHGIFQEVWHRYIASGVGMLTFSGALVAFSLRKDFFGGWHRFRQLAVIVLIQGILGGLTVLMELNPFIVTAHLVLGTIFFQMASTTLYQMASARAAYQPIHPTVLAAYKLSVLVVFIQIILGGFVGSSGAALACLDFPLCAGELLPSDGMPSKWVQIAHRANGILTLCLIVWTIIATRRYEPMHRLGHLYGVLFMIIFQIVIGVWNIYLFITPFMTIAHLVLAQMILLALVLRVHKHDPACALAV
jgi:heme a synthase